MYHKMSLISIEISDKTERLHELKEIVKKFHPVNYDVFKYIITHLNRFSIFLLKFCISCNSCKKDYVNDNELTTKNWKNHAALLICYYKFGK